LEAVNTIVVAGITTNALALVASDDGDRLGRFKGHELIIADFNQLRQGDRQ